MPVSKSTDCDCAYQYTYVVYENLIKSLKTNNFNDHQEHLVLQYKFLYGRDNWLIIFPSDSSGVETFVFFAFEKAGGLWRESFWKFQKLLAWISFVFLWPWIRFLQEKEKEGGRRRRMWTQASQGVTDSWGYGRDSTMILGCFQWCIRLQIVLKTCQNMAPTQLIWT